MKGRALESLFPNSKPVIGVIHVGALPGAPLSKLTVGELTELAVREARVYRTGGVDGIMIENMHDTPYLRGSVGPEIVAAMAVIGQAVKVESKLPIGVQILAAANTEAMAVAHAAGLHFIRAEGYAFAHVADEGLIEASAAELLRYRRADRCRTRGGLGRHQEEALLPRYHGGHQSRRDGSAVEFMRGDAVIVTGSTTGEPPKVEDVREAKAHASSARPARLRHSADNLADYYALADGFIVGSSFKADGHWANRVELPRVQHLMDEARKCRSARRKIRDER